MKKIIPFLLLVFFISPAIVFPKDKEKEKKVQVYDFEGDVIKTKYLKPDQLLIEAISKKKGLQFLKVRKDFYKEIIKSAEEY